MEHLSIDVELKESPRTYISTKQLCMIPTSCFLRI